MKNYFFDLDGTLTDSKSGLIHCYRTAIKELSLPNVDDSVLDALIGAPLPEVFRTVEPNIGDTEIKLGMQAFRKEYDNGGIKKNKLYPVVLEMMNASRENGRTVWIVTAKPEKYAEKVVEILGLTEFISGISGAGLSEIDTKTSLLDTALTASQSLPEDTIFLGDRHYDIIGAREVGIRPVGALWGYGSREELTSAGCKEFASSPRDFQRRFIDRGSKPDSAA